MIPFANTPLQEIPENDRVKSLELAICKGNCNSLRPIKNVKYQLCEPCRVVHAYHGFQCDIPSCGFMGDGKTPIFKKDIDGVKFLCSGCKQYWEKNGKPQWEKLVEDRRAWFARPETYVKALEEGLVSLVQHPVGRREIAECHFCHQYAEIRVPKYQLCSTCSMNLQYHGEKCSVKGTEHCPNDAVNFDTNESRFYCTSCSHARRKYNLASFAIYESQIRTITKCNICSIPVSHNKKEGESQCTAFIDHDHETGKTRGVLCSTCNTAEGYIKKTGKCPEEWAKNLLGYYENPPLTKSWAQES